MAIIISSNRKFRAVSTGTKKLMEYKVIRRDSEEVIGFARLEKVHDTLKWVFDPLFCLLDNSDCLDLATLLLKIKEANT